MRYFRTLIPLLLTTALPVSGLCQPFQSRLDFLAQPLKQGGITGAVVTDTGVNYFKAGNVARDWNRPIRESLFEIGEATMLFTALLTSEAVRVGKISLDTTVRNVLGKKKIASEWIAQVTVRELLTHTSGLPNLPTNLVQNASGTATPELSRAEMLEFITAYQPDKLHKTYQRSQLGYGLLAYLVDREWREGYERLLDRVILRPLNMKRATISLADEQEALLLPGFAGPIRRPAWNYNALAGAGGLRVTPADMGNCLQAFLISEKNQLAKSLENVLTGVNTTPSGAITSFGLQTIQTASKKLIWIQGQTGGFHCLVGLDTKCRLGIVLLSNNRNVRFSPAVLSELMELYLAGK